MDDHHDEHEPKKIGSVISPSFGKPSPLLPQKLKNAKLALQRAEFLFKQFPNPQKLDLKIWTAGVAGVLSEYSEDIILGVTDPRGGMSRIVKWLPVVKEVYDECERRAGVVAAMSKSDAAIAETLQRRREDHAQAGRPHRETLDELRARHGQNWGLGESGQKTPAQKRAESIARLAAASGKTVEEVEAELAKLPDSPIKHEQREPPRFRDKIDKLLGGDDAEAKREAKRNEKAFALNRAQIARGYEAEGVPQHEITSADPAWNMPVSPSLVKQIHKLDPRAPLSDPKPLREII